MQELIDSGKFWELIKHFDEEGYIMCGGTAGEPMWSEIREDPSQAKGGLIPGHAYSVIAAKDAKGNRLLQLRNPWGDFEWDGDWSDNSSLWTQEIKDALGGVTMDANDGTFWMCLKDFVSNFESLDVCRVRNWDEVRVRGRFIRFADSDNSTNEVV